MYNLYCCLFFPVASTGLLADESSGSFGQSWDLSPVGLLPAGIGIMTPSGSVSLFLRGRPTGLFAMCTAPIVSKPAREISSVQGKLSPRRAVCSGEEQAER